MGRLALPPGFRFHPTDEELVSYYLKRKVSGRKIDFEAIGDLDLYKFEPWDLPELSRLQTKDLEWYFFCPRDKKYPNGSRTNRATENGYWKATGKDREVFSRSVSVGMKKTLVYYKGRAPKGERTNWVMHEYRLEDAEGDNNNVQQNGYVLCRIYQKSGAGPKNGEQYGAPVEEENWETGATNEIGDFNSLGASLSTALQSAGASTKPLSEERSHRMVGLKTEPVDLNNPIEEETNFTNLPVEMIAELRERAMMGNEFSGDLETCFNGDLEFGGHDDLIASFLSPPEGEEEILDEIQGLVTITENKAEGKISEEVGYLPRDGDFFELNDLSPIIDFDNNVEREGSLEDIWGLSANTNSWSMKAGWQDDKSRGQLKRDPTLAGSSLCHCLGAGELVDTYMQTEEKPEIARSCTTCILGPVGHASDGSKLQDLCGKHCNTCSMEGAELEYSDVLQFFEQFSTFNAADRAPLNTEFLGGSMSPSLVEGDASKMAQSGGTKQEEKFLDAFTSFSDLAEENLQSLCLKSPGIIEVQESCLKTDFTNKERPAENANAGKSGGAGKVITTTACTETLQGGSFSDVKVLKPEVLEAHSKILDSRGTSKALGAILSCLESLPILPASAADMSPKSGTPVGSISVLASSMDIRAVTLKCSCLKENSSSCVTCSLAKRGTFVSSLSYSQGKVVVENQTLSFLVLAMLSVLWILFWLLMVGGTWKIVGGVFRLVFS